MNKKQIKKIRAIIREADLKPRMRLVKKFKRVYGGELSEEQRKQLEERGIEFHPKKEYRYSYHAKVPFSYEDAAIELYRQHKNLDIVRGMINYFKSEDSEKKQPIKDEAAQPVEEVA